MRRKRMTRSEKQAHTRGCLMKSAHRKFAQRGLDEATIDEVSEDAGFSKGAFYANFKSKEELFLAMLDERFAEKIDQIESAMATHEQPEDQARQAGTDFAHSVSGDPDWQRLFFEFTAFAIRNEDFREELVTRYRSMRGRIAEGYSRRAEELGATSPVPFERLALMTCVIANGFSLEKLLEGDDVPDELLGELLAIFFAGVQAVAAAQEPGHPAEPLPAT
jgi:AcrR family transcriptional regulator